MPIKMLTRDQWISFIQKLIGATRVVGIQEKEQGFYTFAELSDAHKLRLDYDVAYLSPRKYFQPPKETLLTFTTAPRLSVEATFATEPFVLVGVHPYDLKALGQMDRIFEKDNADGNYLARRQAATIVASDPLRATAWSFWPWMDAATVDSGFDLFVTDLGNALLVEIGTDKGAALLTQHATSRDATEEEIATRATLRANFKKLCKPERAVNIPAGEIGATVAKNHEHPVWAEMAEKCYSCGTCNTVCPTCYCFDVREEMDLSLTEGVRTRQWDGCLLEQFASVGSGENFREHRPDRFRHRILRKSSYVPSLLGTSELVCVGCGRCSSQCVPDITDPVKIYNRIAEGK